MGNLNSRSKIRANERILRRKRKQGLGFLLKPSRAFDADLPSYGKPVVLSVENRFDDERDYIDDSFSRISRIKVPAAVANLRGAKFLLTVYALLVDDYGILADPQEHCGHQHDCCGCRIAYTPKVLLRNGREIVVSQSFGRNI